MFHLIFRGFPCRNPDYFSGFAFIRSFIHSLFQNLFLQQKTDLERPAHEPGMGCPVPSKVYTTNVIQKFIPAEKL